MALRQLMNSRAYTIDKFPCVSTGYILVLVYIYIYIQVKLIENPIKF